MGTIWNFIKLFKLFTTKNCLEHCSPTPTPPNVQWFIFLKKNLDCLGRIESVPEINYLYTHLYIEGEGENPADVIKNRIEYRTDS